ncbi:MAG: AmmeMemoRadiSam system protein B [Candidatus Lokiarchaeota archaeon]|nr:AmmeMemoRadiSam system protein B [Candidatus Lokiarchaeota archaeon]
MVIRKASHAGSWYPSRKEVLIKDLESSFYDSKFGPGKLPESLNKETRSIIGAISPHAGYAFSGRCAAFTYLHLFKEKIPDTVIVLGTDHVGYGGVALLGDGAWETPIGNLEIDVELSQKILGTSDIIVDDSSAFTGFMEQEHNIEIQLPFIKYCAKNKDVKIVTIKMGGKKDYPVFETLADDIATSIKALNKDVVIVASSDMSHKNVSNREQLDQFKKIDHDVIDAFVELDSKKTLLAASKTTVCGAQTITTLILICKNLNCSNGKLLKYYTSTDVRGEYGYCVGYFSGILMK